MDLKKTRKILAQVLKKIKPDEDYEKNIFQKTKFVIDKINKNRRDIRAELGGSGAKGTWLKTFDADIFVLFDYSKYKDKSSELSEILEKILKKNFKNLTRLHGSRDYFQIKEKEFTIEIVPILNIKKAEQAKNITDISPLHSKWVRNHKNLISEMKLTKQFCSSQNVYGAESYINGFSGYVCEILTVYYGSFLNLLRNASKWKEKVVIDVEKYYKNQDVFKVVNKSKLNSPLIIIDPVQKERNASAALSNEKFENFKNAAKNFISKPNEYFFIKKDIAILFKDIKKNNILLVIKVKPLNGKLDVVGAKILKIYEFLKKEINDKDFNLIKSDWQWNKSSEAELFFLIDKKQLNKKIEMKGPPLKLNDHVQRFKKLHKKTFIKNNKIYAISKRKFTNPKELINRISKDEYVKERSKLLKIEVF